MLQRLFKRVRKALRLFRYKILISFFAFIRIFVLWLFVYFYINYRQSNLDRFTYHLINLQNQYEEGNRSIQDFIINGYHDSSIYMGGRGEYIERFDSNQRTLLADLAQIKQEAGKNFVSISDSLQAIERLHWRLIDTVAVLRTYYIACGFKDYGAEGKMHRYARFLEDSCPVPKADIMMLRSYEKDFILRSEQKYVNDFNGLIDTQLQKFSGLPATYSALLGYRQAFNDFATSSRRLGINSGDGVFGNLKAITRSLDGSYRRVNIRVAAEITRLGNLFKIILVVTLILLVAASVYLSIVLSSGLTRDIRLLNKYVAAFVRSGFTEDTDVPQPTSSKIAEIQGLIENFNYLKDTLLLTLADLSKVIEEEKELSSSLQVSMSRLNNQLTITAHQQSELIQHRLLFTTLLLHTSAAAIFLNDAMEIIFHNPAAVSLLHTEKKEEVMTGTLLHHCLPDPLSDLFTTHFKTAFSGSETSFSYTLTHDTKATRLHISLAPIRDEEGTVFAVIFWGTENV